MIFRKPYAFLIKYFKIIHIIMFVFFGYLVFALRKIYVFFANYIKTGQDTYVANMASRYVPWVVFLIVIIIFAFSVAILLLMRKKDKPVLFYRIMIGFSVFLLVAFIYFTSFFNSLAKTTYEPLRIVINRDIILFAYLANYFFVIFNFIRGFGFDIKKFSFDRDKKELNLEESDSEEYELSVGVEKNDIKTFFNRHKRELKYYVKENKLILSIVGGVILVFAIFKLYNYFFVVNKVYHEKDEISDGQIVYWVNSSLTTNVDKYGQIISMDDDFLVVNMNIANSGDSTIKLDNQALRVHIGDDYYYPNYSACNLFSDYGTCYTNQNLKSNTNYNYVVIYKIKNDYDAIYLEILKDKGDNYLYNKIKLDYVRDEAQNVISDNKKFTINDEVYEITNYSIVEKTSYQYEECVGEVCNKYTKIVSPNTGDIVLALEISGAEKITDEYLNSAFGIKYGNSVYLGQEMLFITKNGNTLYYSIPAFFKNVSDFDLLVTTRKLRHFIHLGGTSNE